MLAILCFSPVLVFLAGIALCAWQYGLPSPFVAHPLPSPPRDPWAAMQQRHPEREALQQFLAQQSAIAEAHRRQRCAWPAAHWIRT